MSFHDVRFPAKLSLGSSGGPERRTEIVTLANGFEERNTAWAHSRRRYDAGLSVKSLDDMQSVIAFFEARLGRLNAFRWKDWADFKSCNPSQTPTYADQAIGTGDDTETQFQLIKAYSSGSQSYARVISKPIANSVRVAVDGVELSPGQDFAVDGETGVVTCFLAPTLGLEITAGFEFDVPVRFDTDFLEMTVASFNAGEIPQIPVVEVRV